MKRFSRIKMIKMREQRERERETTRLWAKCDIEESKWTRLFILLWSETGQTKQPSGETGVGTWETHTHTHTQFLLMSLQLWRKDENTHIVTHGDSITSFQTNTHRFVFGFATCVVNDSGVCVCVCARSSVRAAEGREEKLVWRRMTHRV